MGSVTVPADRPDQVAVALAGDLGALVGARESMTGSRAEVLARVAALEDERHPRWVWWSAAGTAAPLVRNGIHLNRCWDVQEVHRLVRGGWATDPTLAWAAAHGLDPAGMPRPAGGDLFDFAGGAADGDAGDPDSPVRTRRLPAPRGRRRQLAHDARAGARLGGRGAARPRPCSSRRWRTAPPRVTQHRPLGVGRRAALRRAGAGGPADPPPDPGAADPRRRRAPPAGRGPRPGDPAPSATPPCLAHTPGRESTDLRNPVQVRELLASVGVVVPDTRAWRLEPFRATHPLVEALLDLAQGGADRHDVRLGVAGRPRRRGRPAARRVERVRRRRRTDDGPERPAQPARTAAPRRRGRTRARLRPGRPGADRAAGAGRRVR